MSVTLDHYAYNIRNIARSGQGDSDDDRLNIKQVRFWINQYRAEGMFQITDYGKDIHPQDIQDLGVIPLEDVDKADSNCACVEWGCTIKRIKIPRLVDFPDLRALTYVGLINKQSDFIINKSGEEANTKLHTRFGKLKTRVYPIGEYLYFILADRHLELNYVNVRGVFESPQDVFNYASEGCDPICFDPKTSPYPMPARLYRFILESILRNELNWTTQAINDELNNNRQDNEKLK